MGEGNRREWLARLSLLAASLLMAGLLAEIGLRIVGYDEKYFNPLKSFHRADPRIGYRGKPGFEGRFKRPDFDVLIVHNEAGFRRQEYRRPAASPAQRVFVFGDSTTWGWGVDQGRVFTDRMSLLMPGYEVTNFGLTGSSTAQQYLLFEGAVRSMLVPGNDVLVMFSGTDWNDNVQGRIPAFVDDDGAVQLGDPRGFGSPLRNAIGQRSYLANFLSYSHNLWRARLRQAEGARRALADIGAIPSGKSRQVARDSPEYRIVRHLLGEFEQSCAERGARFIVAPVGAGKRILEVASELGIATVPIRPALKRARDGGRIAGWTLGSDSHWNEEAHQIAAEVLAESILREDAATR